MRWILACHFLIFFFKMWRCYKCWEEEGDRGRTIEVSGFFLLQWRKKISVWTSEHDAGYILITTEAMETRKRQQSQRDRQRQRERGRERERRAMSVSIWQAAEAVGGTSQVDRNILLRGLFTVAWMGDSAARSQMCIITVQHYSPAPECSWWPR